MLKTLEREQRFTDAPLTQPTKPVSGWETINKDQAVENGSGLGFVKGVIALLFIKNGYINSDEQIWQIQVPSFSSRKVYQLSGNNDSWHVIEAKSYLIVVATILDALVTYRETKVVNAWEHFLDELELFLVAKPAFTKEQLHLACQQEYLNDCLFDLCVEVRSFLHRRVKQVELINKPFTGNVPQNKQFYA